MREWTYRASKKSESGYEEVIDRLRNYTKEEYISLGEEGRKAIVEEVFSIYREVNIYPITYFNEEGVKEEILKCVSKDVKWEKDKPLDFKFNQGQSLCRFLFPNLNDISVRGASDNTMISRFFNDHKLKRAIDFALRFKKSVTPPEIRTSLEMIGGGVATNFKAMNAKALYERYCPEEGIIYDFACGFGGRMIGALSSSNNYKYMGVEPCTETFNNLNLLGQAIEKATNRDNIFKIYKMGSEDFLVREPFVDFAFSSPPYFNLEQYSKEETQCYNKFNNLEDWFEGYVRPTIKNIYDLLKEDRYYAVNISDFKMGSKEVKYVDRWIEISREVGFEFIETIDMKLKTRSGNGHKDGNGNSKVKKEGVFVFKKQSLYK